MTGNTLGRTGFLATSEAIDGKATDTNDLMLARVIEAVRKLIDSATPSVLSVWTLPPPITPKEWGTARLTPDCIVQDYLFADVGVQVAPGGTGKTTLNLYESIHIALGLPLYGLQIHKPGPVVILTAEDSREMLTARLRRIAEVMQLMPAQVERVRELVRISDVCGTGLRLTNVIHEVVKPAGFVDALAEGLQELQPVLVNIDPAVSFGCGEARVNDAEQGLIEAARRLRRELNCCVRFVHHTGKAVARDKILDMYAGRGGSAFADGARMVHVLQPLDAADWRKATGNDLEPDESGLVLARPKMSYCPPQGIIYLRRRGYLFEHVEASKANPLADLERDAETILAVVRGLDRPTQNTLTSMDTGLSRDRTRVVIRYLLEDGRLVYRHSSQKGGAQKYLEAPDSRIPSAHLDETAGSCADEYAAKVGARPYRESESRAPSRGLSPPLPKVSGDASRAPSARLAHLDHETWDSEI
jgi:RecA-family ATPase